MESIPFMGKLLGNLVQEQSHWSPLLATVQETTVTRFANSLSSLEGMEQSNQDDRLATITRNYCYKVCYRR